MSESVEAWERSYREVESLWDIRPVHELAKYASLVPDDQVLDIGVGEGRNAHFFANMGHQVEGVDLSETAVRRAMRRAREANLEVDITVGDLLDYAIAPSSYALIIASMVLQFFKKP